MNYILDIECYTNYFLMVFLPVDGSEPLVFEKHNDVVTINTVETIDWSGTFITFNGIGYDFPMWGGLWALKTNLELKQMSDAIILDNIMWWTVEREFGITIPSFDHIDIIQVLPLTGSLKIYGGRIASKKLQDLPIEPDAIISDSDAAELLKYCINDCEVTLMLYGEVTPQIELRVQMGEKYGLDLRSKSDAQIAEVVLASEFTRRTGLPVSKPGITQTSYRYTPPPFVKFKSEQMNEVLRNIMLADFEINPKNGQVVEPAVMKQVLEINSGKYKMGIGGLHSVDKPGSFYSTNDYDIYDIDAAAYYPFIILNAGFYPQHMGEVFLDIYRELVERRIEAKKTGDKVTDSTIKIVINGTFGKLGSKYSKIYAPDLMFHTTITGQLCLLMLIEQQGMNVISANTDGIMVMMPKRASHMSKLVCDWQELTGFTMEYTQYKSVHRRDVNNYLAIKPDGTVKTKGIFAPSGLSKNPANSIIYEAVIAEFKTNMSIEHTIKSCTDVNKFLTLRTVKGGAKWGDELLGKSVRWYHSWLSATQIEYQSNGNKVPLSEGSAVLQDLPETLPYDIDYKWYVDEAIKLKAMME